MWISNSEDPSNVIKMNGQLKFSNLYSMKCSSILIILNMIHVHHKNYAHYLCFLVFGVVCIGLFCTYSSVLILWKKFEEYRLLYYTYPTTDTTTTKQMAKKLCAYFLDYTVLDRRECGSTIVMDVAGSFCLYQWRPYSRNLVLISQWPYRCLGIIKCPIVLSD